MKSLLGLHWIREHPDRFDFDHIAKMQYPSVKVFKPFWDNRDACANLLAVLPRDSYILGRDHELSEQKEDSYRDPVGTGTRHANEWAEKLRNGQCHLPTDRTFFLGINEPNADSGDRHAIDKYTEAFLDRLRTHGLRGGAFNFSTGHPRTVDGTGNTPADYSVFERSHQAIIRGHHIGVLHIYGTAAVPCAPGHYDRLKACPWQDVEWVVGECGADEHVIGGGNHDGFLISMNGHIHDYAPWLDRLIMGVNDPRIHSYQVFTYDFSHPWSSFDVSEIRDVLESYSWQHMRQAPTATPPDVHIPTAPNGHPTGTGPQPAPATPAYVTAIAGANFRKAPRIDGDLITAIAYGEPVLVYPDETGTNWRLVEYKGNSGYIRDDLLGDKPQGPPTPAPMGDNWQRSLAFVLRWEGLWADDPNDPGGATMKGITFETYKRWRKARGQSEPTKDNLRNIPHAVVEAIYYQWYWLESGADQLPWPLCLCQMDTAVNAGVDRAQEMLTKSNGNFLAYMGHLLTWYAKIDNFDHFGRAWTRRRADLLLEASK